MSDEKRKLKLMPEVLPDPRLAKRDRDRAPRERTIAHMKKLLALATSASAIAACTKGYAVVDPLPPPTSSVGPMPVPDAGVVDADTPFGPFAPLDASVGTMDDTDPIVDAGHDAGTKKKPPHVVSTVPTRGYMVVDPLPPPTSMSNPKNRKP